MGNDDGCAAFLLGLLQRAASQERKLLIVDGRGFGSLAGNDAGVFEHIAIQTDNGDERHVEGEVDRGLRHGRADQAAGFGGAHRFRIDEIAQKCVQRGHAFASCKPGRRVVAGARRRSGPDRNGRAHKTGRNNTAPGRNCRPRLPNGNRRKDDRRAWDPRNRRTILSATSDWVSGPFTEPVSPRE